MQSTRPTIEEKVVSGRVGTHSRGAALTIAMDNVASANGSPII